MPENHAFFVRGDDGEQYYPELVALLAEMRVTGLAAAGPVLAPIGRRILAGMADLVLVFFLIMPLIFLTFFLLLPVDQLAQLARTGVDVLQGVIPQNPPQLPLWFEAVLDAIRLLGATLYYAGFYAAHGRTPAKSVLRLEVVDAQGRKPVLVKALLRALVFVVSVYIFYGIPLIYAFLNPQRRALHDMVAGTYVVER
jgi:uncharacterized RDD family membrane protein YckC